MPIDMLISAVSVLVVAQSSSEIPEGLMNNPVYYVGKVTVVHVHHMNVCRRVEVRFPSLSNAALLRCEWSPSYPVRCTIEGRTPELIEQEAEVKGNRVVLDVLYFRKIFCFCQNRTPDLTSHRLASIPTELSWFLYYLLFEQLLRAFAKLASLCLSVRLSAYNNRLPLDRFARNFIPSIFSKIYREYSSFTTI